MRIGKGDLWKLREILSRLEVIEAHTIDPSASEGYSKDWSNTHIAHRQAKMAGEELAAIIVRAKVQP